MSRGRPFLRRLGAAAALVAASLWAAVPAFTSVRGWRCPTLRACGPATHQLLVQPPSPRRVHCSAHSVAAPYVSFEDVLLSEPLGPSRERELSGVVDSLFEGGMGLIPTDTQHAYVTAVSSKRGTQRIYAAKGIDPDERKPLSLLCSSLSMASRYADIETVPRRWFQLMKRMLPGPFTFILQATKEVPRVVVEHKSRRRLWERREVGIRIPDCAVVQYLTEQIGEPLLASSFCKVPAELWSAKRGELDFVVAGTDIQRMWDGVVEEDRISTVLDLTMEEPVLRRQGLGDVSAFFE